MILRRTVKALLVTQNSPIADVRWMCHQPSAEPVKRPITSNAHSARYCLELVRRNDYENFICTLLVDGAQRQSAIAIRAFNVEVANIASVVSDDKIGAMRLHFWHNAVKSIFETTPNSTIPDHPVVRELHRVVVQSVHRPQRLYFSRLIKARERPAHQGFVTVKALEQYAEESTSSNLYLLASIAGVNNIDVDHALSHLGKAQGIVNMLRAQGVQRHRRTAFCVFPQETLMKHGISQERALRDAADDAGVRECTFDVASVAHSHLENARKLSAKVPDQVKRLLLPAVAVERYLERLRRADFHLSHSSLSKRDSMLPFWYYWNYWRNQY